MERDGASGSVKKQKKTYSPQDKRELFLIFLCWVVYTSAYLGKYSFNTNKLPIGKFYGVEKDALGLVGTVFFATYGCGQIINGLLCRFYPRRVIIPAALLLSAATNFILYFDIPFHAIKYLWFLNAVGQSILWPTLIQTIGCYISDDKIKFSVLVMSTTVATGTILSYLLSAACVSINFRLTFVITAVHLVLIALLWFFGFKKASEKLELRVQPKAEKSKTTCDPKIRRAKLMPFVALMLCFAFFAIVDNFIKDGLNNWTPNILNEIFGLKADLSILFTIILSVLGIFGAVCAVSLNKYIGNLVVLNGFFFIVASVLLGCVIVFLRTSLWVIVLMCFGAIALVMHAINNVITSMFPLHAEDKSRTGLYSGLLNGACYLGSALSDYGLGALAKNSGWQSVFILLLVCALICVAISMTVAIYKAIKKNHKVVRHET